MSYANELLEIFYFKKNFKSRPKCFPISVLVPFKTASKYSSHNLENGFDRFTQIYGTRCESIWELGLNNVGDHHLDMQTDNMLNIWNIFLREKKKKTMFQHEWTQCRICVMNMMMDRIKIVHMHLTLWHSADWF